jgi:VWFA-related protein
VLAQDAATAYQGTTPLFKANASAVAVDVVVSKCDDEPVRGLSKQDFEVLEDGKPQTVDFFAEHTASDVPLAAPAQMPANEYANLPAAPASDSVNVLLLDTLNTEPLDQINVRRQIDRFVAKIRPGTPVAIFSLGSKLKLVQDFTADAALLRAALSSKHAEGTSGARIAVESRGDEADANMQKALMAMSGATDAGSPALMQLKAEDRALLTLQALEQLSRNLAGVPGRKNLIWFASSFPVAIFPTVREQQSFNHGPEFTGALHQTADLLTASRVAVYPVDAEGIHIDRSTGVDSGGSSEGDNLAQDQALDLANHSANIAAMEQLAGDTGGEALYTSNNMSQAVARAMEYGAHYYTLIYTPPSTPVDGKFHRIEVKLAQGKYKLAYRRGYYADSAMAPAAAQSADPLVPVMAHGAPSATQVLYRVRVQPAAVQPAPDARRAGGNAKLRGPLMRYSVDFNISAASLELESAADGAHTARIELALLAYDREGKPLNWTGGSMNMSLNAASYAKAQRSGIGARMEIDLPEGDVSLASGVYDLIARKAGALEILLDVRGAPTAVNSLATPRSQ